MGEVLEIHPLDSNCAREAVGVINAAAAWYAEFLPAGEVRPQEMTEAEWREEAGRMTWLGAFDRDELIGVIGVEPKGRVALLRHAYVLPRRQRGGVGALLLHRAELEARRHGAERLIAGTYARNARARRLLEKAGFRESADSDAVLRAFYDIPDDRRRSSLTLEKVPAATPPGGDEGS